MFGLVASLLAVTPAAAPAGTLPIPAVVERMQKNYDQARDFKAQFTQTYTNATFKRTKKSTGTVTFKKPGLMRWDYDTPQKEMILSTGKVLWLYQPDDQAAYKQDLKTSQLPASLAFLMGKGKLADQFEIAPAGTVPYGSSSDYRLSLKPKEPQSTYQAMIFVVDPKTFFVTESVLTDSQGNVNDIAFTDLKVNTKIPESQFRWEPPKGVHTVDTGKLGR